MNDEQIMILKERVKKGDIWWIDCDNKCKKVSTVNLKWLEFKDEPENYEPAAILSDGLAVSLLNTTENSFVTIVISPIFN
jgi:hypothetical protein